MPEADKTNHKYLNAINISSKDDFIFNTDHIDKNHKTYKKQRKIYGFDERETWCLSYTTITWLYSHLKFMLEFEKFDNMSVEVKIPVLVDIPKSERAYFPNGIDFKEYHSTRKEKMSIKKAAKTTVSYMEEYLYLYNSTDTKDRVLAKEYFECSMKIASKILLYLN